jgi:DNA-binding response OmpR family regulator
VSSAVEGLKSGASDYLVKPCDLDELIKKINAAAEMKSRRENEILDVRMKPYVTSGEKERRISEIISAAAKGERKI